MHDPSTLDCMGTVESVVTHGANAVCHVPRADAWHPSVLAVAALLGGSVLGVLVLSQGPRARRLLGVALALAALPGLWQLARHRADAPPRHAATVATVRALHDALARYTPAAGCADRAQMGCEACVPIARLALVAPRCRTLASVVIEPGALGGTCHVGPGAIRCTPSARASH